MPEENKEYRKLSAIMFTDMVGYSAMVQKNESLALELLQEHRKILRPIFSKHGGKEIETAGDAFFVEFDSALKATECAIEIQKTLNERNLNVENDKKILIRIGTHVGDVVHMGKHVHGDGVNIAARLEPLSPPGGLTLSEDVYRQIHNKIDLPFVKLKRQNLKNIKTPIDIYTVNLPWVDLKKHFKKKRSLAKYKFFFSTFIALIIFLGIYSIWNSKVNSSSGYRNNRIAVLPLLNISNDSQDDYFADGMTEELISQLAKISGLNVIARTSVMRYKNTPTDIEQIGKELDVSTILEGSVRTAANNARITLQLVDVNTQEPVWTEEYDRELKDIFNIQTAIALRVAKELKIKLVKFEKEQIEKTGTTNADAYRFYLMGKQQLNIRTAESIFKAIEHFETAQKLDSTYALAYVGIADCYTLIGGAGFGNYPRDKAINKAKNSINKALQLDETLAEAYNSLAYLQFRMDWDWKNAEKNFKKAIEFKPGYAAVYERYSLFLTLLGRYEEALPLMQRAYELDPLSASISTGIGRIYHFEGKYDDAIRQFKKTLTINPDYVEAVFGLGLSYSEKQMFNDAITELKKALELSNGRLIIMAALGNAYADAGMRNEALKIYKQLSDLSNEEKISPLYFAVIDAAMGNYSQAIDSLYKAYNEHFGILVYIKASPLYDNLRSEERFVKLMEMIGLEK